MAKKPNPWANLTPEQKQARVDRMLKARKANQRFVGSKEEKMKHLKDEESDMRQALPVEIERMVVPIHGGVKKHSNGLGSIDDLAELIIAVWRKL